jgi:hypothetical protein
MPYPVQNLIEGRGEPVCVGPSDSVQKALEIMIENDFSQLPVIDDLNRPLGMITYESILQALNNLGVGVDKLSVDDAYDKAHTYRPEEDLFDLLDRLRDINAVLIVDGDKKLIGIVTTFDSTGYFRRRAEDMMLVEDIEGMLKDSVLSFFSHPGGEQDDDQLKDAIDKITASFLVDKSTYGTALRQYLENSGHSNTEIVPQALEKSYLNLRADKEPRDFDQLTFYDYMHLFLSEDIWQVYAPILKQDKKAIENMLDAVRKIRNDLAHFREINATDRSRLKFCAEWLARHQAPIVWPIYADHIQEKSLVVREERVSYEINKAEDEIIPTEEELDPRESRYTPLAIWLQSQPGSKRKVQFSFSDIEEIIGGELPNSARKHRAWWANDSVGHSHSQLWLEAGWRASFVSLAEEKVTFARVAEREKAYIDFFSNLLGLLRDAAPFKVKEVSPGGQSWIIVFSLPERGPQLAILSYSFAKNNRFRVELYIDTGDKQENKSVFDELYRQKAALEEALDTGVSWERIDDKRASRIAIYKDGSISDSEDKLNQLREWAVDTMIRFYNAIAKPATKALKKYSQRA